MRITILDDYFDTLRTLPGFHKLDGHEVTVWNDHEPDIDALVERLQDTEVLVLFRERTQIPGELLDRLPNLQLISQRSVYPHVDVDACTRNGVLLCSNQHQGTPSYGAAELTWGLILSAMYRIPEQAASLKAGTWQAGVGKSLRGRTIGIYGYGRIGRTIADFARVFGMNVWWWSSEDGRKRAADDGQPVATDRESFFGESDIVTVHVRLKPTTYGLITLYDLMSMRRDALFVNTSRAGLIEPGALLQALEAGRPGHAAVDVYDHEPVTDPTDPLVSHPNLLGTPHIGYVTGDELELQFSDIYDQILAYIDGNPVNMINPEVLNNWG